ncbi:hypothetical protein [Acinetobacter guillouiae]|uniref:hypothetical protein n=1 Tax=Acinetobacter guillouiae TaxID=106649 RepID=UPI001CD5AB73|nr:hypothetical protein [Acinetobacter guillouiae]
MSNNLNGLLPTLYAALDIVSREITGFIPAVTRDTGIERAAVGDDVKIPVTTVAEAQDTKPGVHAPDAGDGTVDNIVAKITKSRNGSPLSNDELAKVDLFIKKNIDEISKLSFENFENIRFFQPKITNFDQYLGDLTVNEKTRAWFYLFTNAKKARRAHIAKQGKDYPNPNYSSDMTAKPKLKGEVVFGLIVLAIIFSFAIYKFVFSTNDYEKCVENGIQYYKDIGSYPILKSENISANSKAKDNCSRSTVAFGDID